MATKTRKKKQTKTSSKKCGRPGGNPGLSVYKWKPKVPGKPKSNNLTVRVDDEMFNGIKKISGWQDKLRAKIDELLQEENAQNYQTGGEAGLGAK
ncbi:MAG: hypothetical protein SWX82_31245 [Cyanobacteriota bacterium]|nr:hypothetical protein [Cyanobacteriota bacterium]